MAVQSIEAAQERMGEIHSNPEIAAVHQLLTKERPPPHQGGFIQDFSWCFPSFRFEGVAMGGRSSSSVYTGE